MIESGLHALLVASLVSACLLMLISTAMVGRKLADMDYQRARGLDVTTRIQAVVNVRTHALRVFVGITFATFAVLLLADAPMIWRQWVNRTLFALVPAAYVIATVLDWLAERQQMKIEVDQEAAVRETRARTAREAEAHRLATLQADHDSYREMAAEAIRNLETAAAKLHGNGERPATLAPVVPEHNSPSTPEQQAEAERATLRARLTASTLDLGLPPREADEAPPPAPPLSSVDIATIQPAAAKAIADAQHRED